ncbi:MAG: hypothetical protein GY862_05810, partial [Gammaproteobacteria bacterium]|nr:hypothetical protein [Gammaproteobacteria bacterium]
LQIAHFEAAGEDSVITDAAFASNILISPSLAGALPNTGKLLENAAAGVNPAAVARAAEEITATSIASGDWQIRELYSNEDGSAQFIELYYNGSSAASLDGAKLLACDNSNPGGCLQVCDDNSPNCTLFDEFVNSNTAESGRRHVLFATPSFEALPGGGSIKTEEQELDANGNPALDADGNPAFKFKPLPSRGVKPDYEIPFNFLSVKGGHVELFLAGESSAAAQFTYSKLPINGLCSLHSGDANVKEDPACSKYAAAAGQTAGALQPLLVSRNFPVNSANEEGTVSNGHSHAIYNPATQILKIPAIMNIGLMNIEYWQASFFFKGTNAAGVAIFELLNASIRSQDVDGHYARYHAHSEYDKVSKTYGPTIYSVKIPIVIVKVTESSSEDDGSDITSHRSYDVELRWIKDTDPMQFELYSIRSYPDIDIHLEFDMPDCVNDLRIAQNLPWPPKTNRKGVEHTLETIFSGVGVDITIVEDLSAKRQDGRLCSDPYTDKQLHQFMDDNSSLPEGVDKTEYIHVAFLPDHVTAKGYGAMASGGMPADSTDIIPPLPPTHPDYHTWVNRNKRNSVIVFVEKFEDAQSSLPAPNDGSASGTPLPITYEEEFLRSTTHEIGHGLNLLHSDGGGESAPSIMDAAKTFAKDIKNRWSYRWSTLKAREHFLSHSLGFPDPEGYDPVNRIRPATEFGFLSCHSTKGEICPVKEAGPSACEDTR